MLSNGQVYKVLMRKGLHHEGKTPAQGLSWDRNFLFQTDSLGVGDQVFDLISSDPSMDVRFSAAEVFAKEQPKLVFDFLYPLLDDGNPETAMRAANYLSSGLLNLDYIGQLPQDQQVETLTDLLSKIMKYVDQNSRDLNTRKAAAFMDFQYFPTLGQQFNLIQSLLEQSWLGLPVKQEVVENLKLEQWLFGMMLKDFPQKTYTEYERIYYGSVRTLIKDILNNHVIDRDKFRSIDYKLYEKMPLKSEED